MATLTKLGAWANNKSSTYVSSSSQSVAEGDILIACVAGDTAFTLVECNVLEGKDFTQLDNAVNSGNVEAEIWIYEVATTESVYINARNLNEDAKTLSLYKVTGLAESPLDKSATGTGSGDNPKAGPTATLSQADEIGISIIAMEEQTDEKGTWTDDATHVYDSDYDQEAGTSGAGGASNISIFTSAEILSATTAQNVEQTSTGSNDWAAIVCTFKAAVAGGPTGVKTINEVAIGSVKTINEVAIANVSTINDAS